MKKIVLICIFITLTTTLRAQEENSSRQQFEKAELLLFNNEYDKAAQKYESLLENDPTNKNIWFHLALCYVNITEENKKAIYYLKKIFSTSTIGDYKRENDYFLYLGKLYHIDFAEEQLITKGFKLDPNMPLKNQAISGDGRTLVFLNSLKSENRIYCTHKNGETWSDAVEITDQIGSGGNCFPSSLSYNGQKLYLTKYDNFESDIYVSTFNGKIWSGMKKPGNINTLNWETHACESKNGKVLYFASNRPDGVGGMDIYYSNWSSNGWSKPVNAGLRINTFLNDDYPLLTNDGATLIYSSQGFKKGKDGYDIYYCNSTGTNWTEPENIGFPVNTSDDDLTFVPLTEETQAFFNLSLLSQTNADKKMAKNDLKVLIIGKVGSHEKKTNLNNTETQIIDNKKGNTISTVMTDSTGVFQTELVQGDYSFRFRTYDSIIKIANFYIPFITREDTIQLNINIDSKPKEPIIAQYKGQVSKSQQKNNSDSTEKENPITNNIPSIDTTKKTLPSPLIQDSVETKKTSNLFFKPKGFTIQIYAKRKLSKELYFAGIDSISVYKGKDGLYRYIYGVFKSEDEAALKLQELKDSGHHDVFSIMLEQYSEQELVYSKRF